MRELRGAGLVAAREFTDALRRKSYWAIIAVVFLGSTAAMVVPALISNDGPTTYEVAVDHESPAFEQAVKNGLATFDAEANVQVIGDSASVHEAVSDGQADVGVTFDDPTRVVVSADDHPRLVAVVQGTLAKNTQQRQLMAAGLSEDQARSVLTPPPTPVEHVDPDRGDRTAASSSVSVVLYVPLMILMMQVANGTAIEKSNRISEVLLAIVRPRALLFGKVLGVTATGLLVLFAATAPVIAKLALGGDLPAGLGAAVAGGAVWFLLGLVLYLTLAGALGALVERQEELTAAVAPLMAVLIGTFLLTQTPDTTVAAVLAYVPLCSSLIMPARLAAGVSSPIEVVGSLLIGFLAAVALARFAVVVYQRAIVRTGRRLHLRDLIDSP